MSVAREWGGRGGASNYQCITECLRVLCLKPIGNVSTGCFENLLTFDGLEVEFELYGNVAHVVFCIPIRFSFSLGSRLF